MSKFKVGDRVFVKTPICNLLNIRGTVNWAGDWGINSAVRILFDNKMIGMGYYPAKYLGKLVKKKSNKNPFSSKIPDTLAPVGPFTLNITEPYTSWTINPCKQSLKLIFPQWIEDKKEIERFEKEVNRLKRHLDYWQKLAFEWSETAKKLTEEIKKLKEENEKLHLSSLGFKHARDRYVCENELLQKEWRTSSEEMSRLEKINNELKDQIKSLNEANEELIKENKNLITQFNEYHSGLRCSCQYAGTGCPLHPSFIERFF